MNDKKPVFKSVPTYRNYEDYHDAEQYTRGWNDAMRFIFGIDDNRDDQRRIFNPYDHRGITEI